MLERLLAALRKPAPTSAREAILLRRDRLGIELHAAVYRYDNRSYIVSATLTEPGFVLLETGDPIVLPIDASDEELGRTAIEQLLRQQRRVPPNLRNSKISDWGAFQVSEARSVKAFQERSWFVRLETAADAISLEAGPQTTLHPELVARVTTPIDEAGLGRSIRHALAEAETLHSKT